MTRDGESPAADALRRCIALGPDEGMLDDAQKLLETITG
jgi:hypothetical protein